MSKSRIFWKCPQCKFENDSWIDVFGYPEKPEYYFDKVPCNTSLKYVSVCEKCGDYELVDPQEDTNKNCIHKKPHIVSYVIKRKNEIIVPH